MGCCATLPLRNARGGERARYQSGLLSVALSRGVGSKLPRVC